MILPPRAWPAERWLSLAALLVSLAGFWFALNIAAEDRLHRQFLIQPKLDFAFRDNDNGSGWVLVNRGQGNASVRWFAVYLDGVPQPHWKAILAALRVPLTATLEHSTMTPGFSVNGGPATEHMLWTHDADAANIFRANRPRVILELCYCSLYQECWLARTDTPSRPHPCPREEADTKPRFVEPQYR
jgi:hypothetical protein